MSRSDETGRDTPVQGMVREALAGLAATRWFMSHGLSDPIVMSNDYYPSNEHIVASRVVPWARRACLVFPQDGWDEDTASLSPLHYPCCRVAGRSKGDSTGPKGNLP